MVKYTWDEAKRRKTLTERGLDFADAPTVMAGATFTFEDTREAYPERRFVTLGLLGVEVVVIVHSEEPGEVRIISMRKGTRNEQAVYFANW